jgi:hypothetical protein
VRLFLPTAALDPAAFDDEVVSAGLDLHAVEPVLDDVELSDSAGAPAVEVDGIGILVRDDDLDPVDVHGPTAMPCLLLEREAACRGRAPAGPAPLLAAAAGRDAQADERRDEGEGQSGAHRPIFGDTAGYPYRMQRGCRS